MMMIANPDVCRIIIFADIRDYMHSWREMRLLLLMQGHVSFRFCGYKGLLGMLNCSQTRFIGNQHLSL